MYTFCRIRWCDDDSEQVVVIKATEEDVRNDDDDKIFFFGIPPETLREYMENKTVVEGEWQVIDIYETLDKLS